MAFFIALDTLTGSEERSKLWHMKGRGVASRELQMHVLSHKRGRC